MLRVIREVEPPTPRSRISTSEALPSLAATPADRAGAARRGWCGATSTGS